MLKILTASHFVSKVAPNWHEQNLKRQLAVLDQREWICFRIIKLVHSVELEVNCIRKIDGVLSHQKVCRKNKELMAIFEM